MCVGGGGGGERDKRGEVLTQTAVHTLSLISLTITKMDKK